MTTYTVTTLADTFDPNDGVVSLRDAMISATFSGGADTIKFAANLSGGTINLTGNFLYIGEAVSILGDIDGNGTPDITVNAAGIGDATAARAFYVYGGNSLIDGLTITGGHLDANTAGGAILVDSGAEVTIRHSVLTGNSAGNGGAVAVGADSTVTLESSTVGNNTVSASQGLGGGIFNNGGTVNLTDVTVSGNAVDSKQGGGLYNTGTATLTRVAFSGNTAEYGGGLANSGGTVDGTDVAFTDNEAVLGSNFNGAHQPAGGGLYNINGRVTLVDASFTGNSAGNDGGAIYSAQFGGEAILNLTNALVSGNSAGESEDGGGGIVNFDIATLVNVTISGNSSEASGGGLYNPAGATATLTNVTISGNSGTERGGGISNGGVLTLTNSIVAGNASPGPGADIFQGSTPTFNGRNIFSQPGAGDADDIVQTNLAAIFAQTGANPFTGVFSGVLANNGGPLQTIRIMSGGTAHDAGVTGNLPFDPRDLDHDGITNEPLPADARGYVRVSGGAVDIGAFELVTTAVARNDAVVAKENAAKIGNVFADNGFLPDAGDVAYSVIKVNGVAASVGQLITLASGTTLKLNANGTFSYNPNHVFDALPDFAASGASNATATDSFTYTVTGGSTATATVTIRGVDSNDRLSGTADADALNGGAGNDFLTGLAGADTLAGGAGNDVYVNPESVDTIVEAAGAAGGAHDRIQTLSSFNISTVANVEDITLVGAANVNAIGNNLANILTGNPGKNIINGGGGADTITGGGGNDTMNAGAGADLFKFATTGTGADTINGFEKTLDHFDLAGGTFSARAESGGSTTLTHAGGTILVTGVTGLSLTQWKALIVTTGREAPDSAAAADAYPTHSHTDIAPIHWGHADFLFA